MTDPYRPPESRDSTVTLAKSEKSRWVLWASLLAPSVAILIANLVVAVSRGAGAYGANYLAALPPGGIVLVVAAIAFVWVTARERRDKFWPLQFAYIAGQIVLCFIVWGGSCSALIKLGLEKNLK
jgi:hypothetical protein